jgi:hypothetical protein
MQLPPPNNFSIAKSRNAYSGQRQGVSGRAYERLYHNLLHDPNLVNFSNFQARVDVYLAKLKYGVLAKIKLGESARDYLHEEITKIIQELQNIQNPPTPFRAEEIRCYHYEFGCLAAELFDKNPAEQEQHIIDLIGKYTELQNRIAELIRVPTKL